MLEPTVKNILKVSVPLMFGTFIQSIVAFTDAAFVSRLGTISFDAVGNASLIYLAFYMLSRGIGDGTQIKIAEEYGKGNKERIGSIFKDAFFLQITLGVLLVAVMFVVLPNIIKGITQNTMIAQEMIVYLKYRSFGFCFASLELILVAFLIAIGRTKIIVVAAVILAGTNIFLDYALIFGEFGLPKLGTKGAAAASSIAELISFTFLLVFVLKSEQFKSFGIRMNAEIIEGERSHLLRLSVPLMLQGFISVSTWLVFFTFIEQMGEKELEASQCIRHIYFLAFIPLFGFAAATKTFVSNLKGQNRIEEIVPVIKRLTIMSALALVLFFHGSVLYPEKLIALVSGNTAIYSLAGEILFLVSGSMLIFSITIIISSSISGLGKTNISFIIELITILIYILACLVIFLYLNWEVKYTWIVEYVYFVISGLFSLVYLRYYFKKLLK